MGVKKHYNGNRLSFVNEINALYNLRLSGCNVPAIMDIDFNNLTLTFSYILGTVVREVLAKSEVQPYDISQIQVHFYPHS